MKKKSIYTDFDEETAAENYRAASTYFPLERLRKLPRRGQQAQCVDFGLLNAAL